jgi:hypothetical protein
MAKMVLMALMARSISMGHKCLVALRGDANLRASEILNLISFQQASLLGLIHARGSEKTPSPCMLYNARCAASVYFETQVFVTVEYFSLSLTSWRLILELVATAVAK